MKPLTTALVILTALGSSMSAQGAAPAPTPFEAFASKSSAQVLFTRQVGSFDSSDAKLRITVLIVSDTESPPDQMRGLRFDLENNSKQDQVYLDEEQLTSAKRELAGIEHGIPALKAGEGAAYRVEGTASCWRPDPARRILCPGYYVGPDNSGLILQALGGPSFLFPDRKPSELTDLIDHALATLKQH